MRNIKLLLEFDGTNYAGWQRQNNALTIQQVLEEALEKLTGEKISTIGCSRTDAGVHAKGYVVNFNTLSKLPEDSFKKALNYHLPKDVVVLSSVEAAEEFHARYSCKYKTYSYSILNREAPAALNRNYLYHRRGKLVLEDMQKASKVFIGTHDFEAFRNTGSSVKTTVRTITHSSIEREGDLIIYRVTGDGFLYNMVRIMIGTLIEVGCGKGNWETVLRALKEKDKSYVGATAPAEGLCLEKVYY